LRRLVAEDEARGVDAVDADVPLGPAAERALRPDVALLDLHREPGREETRIAELALLDHVDDRQVAGLEVKPVRDHELGPGVAAMVWGESGWVGGRGFATRAWMARSAARSA